MGPDGLAPQRGKSLSVTGAQNRIARVLTEHNIEGARLEARIMLSHITGLSRTDLLLEPDRPLSDQSIAQLQKYMNRRLLGEPLAYILGTCEFYGIEFLVDRSVLIPRPETELLVDLAVKAAESLVEAGISSPVIADIGTGSGCIAIALAAKLPGARIYGTDISSEALKVAAANCHKNGVDSRITLLEGDLCAPLPGQLNVVTANLPYVRTDEITSLARELSWEPRLALDGGADGLKYIERLIDDIAEKLAPGAVLLLELGLGQAQAVLHLARNRMTGSVAQAHKDLAGIDRIAEVKIL